jgi:von Willebrand factor type A domain
MILALIAAALAAEVALSGAQQVGESRTALVTVSDARNRSIVDLGPDDFVITEGGQPREILDARMADYPVVILIDTGAGTRDSFPEIRKAVAQFIARLGQRPIALGTMDDPPVMAATFDDDRKVLARRLEALVPDSSKATQPLEAASAAAGTMRDAGSRFSAIVVVSGAAEDAKENADMMAPIIDSGAVVHAVVNRGSVEAPLGAAMDVVRRLSDQTHGQFTPIFSPASYQVALGRLADRLSTEMMIEYIVPPRSAATDIQVGVRIPGARARGLGVRPR